MQLFLEWLVAGIIVVLGPMLTIFDLPGNSLMMLTSLGFAFMMKPNILICDCFQLWCLFMYWGKLGSFACPCLA